MLEMRDVKNTLYFHFEEIILSSAAMEVDEGLGVSTLGGGE